MHGALKLPHHVRNFGVKVDRESLRATDFCDAHSEVEEKHQSGEVRRIA